MISAPKESILRAGLDASEYTRGAAEIDRANEGMASSAAEVERANQSGAAALAAFEETEKRSARAKRELAQSQKIIAAAVERGAITEADASAKLAAAQERYERTLSQTTEQKRRTASAQDEMTRSIVTSASSVDRLQASLDKGFAAQLRYEQVVDRVNAAMERGRISQERGAQIISLAQQKYMTAATSTAALGAAAAAAATSGRNFGAVAQQAGYQIGDFASQVASGGSAVTAFIQQGSQMLGMFGMFGAVAGAALAIGGIAYQMWAARDAAKGATDEVSALTAEIKRLNEESAKRGGGQPGIRANVMLEDLMAERRRLVGMLPSTGGATAATSEMQGFIEAQAASEVSRIQGQIDAIDKLIREYDRLVMEQERVDESTAVLKRRGEEFEDQKKREAEAVREAARIQEEVERTQQAFTDRIRQTILQLDPATAAAERYADQQLLLRTALEDGMIAQDQYTALLATAGAAYESATRTVDRYGEALDQQAQRLREQLDPNVAYAAELNRIGELYRMNRISVEEYAAADEAARNRIFRQTERIDDATRQLGFTFQSAFEDAIVKGEKLRNVLAGIAQDIARMIIRQTVTTPLAGLVTSGITSLLGGAPAYSAPSPVDLGLPGFGGVRAAGGPVSSGTAYLVGEEGPELFVPSASGQIIPNGESMGGAVVNQTINISVGVAQTVRAELASLMPAIKRQTIDAVADARMRGGSFAAAMGT